MKSPMLLACALITAITFSGVAQENAPAAEAGRPKQIKNERPNRGPMTPEQRKAMMDKRLEQIKEKDEALYKELEELRDKDPEAFRTRMREMGRARALERQQQGKGQALGDGQGRGKGPRGGKRGRQQKADADQPKAEQPKDEQ